MRRAVLTSSTTLWFRALPVLGVVIPSVFLIWSALAGLDASTILFLDDQAFSMMLGELIRDGTMPLLGLPSHLGGRHVGPFYLWIMGSVVAVGDGDPVTVTKLLTMMKVGAVLLLGGLAYRICSSNGLPRLISFSIVLLASCCGVYSWILRVDWANNFLLVSSVVALWATYLFFERGRTALSLCAAAWSLLLQTHLSAAPFIAGVGCVCIWRLVFHSDSETRKLPVLIQTVGWGAFAALWIAPLYYEIRYESNLVALFSAHTIKSSEGAGISSASLTFFAFLKGLLTPFTSSTPDVFEYLLLVSLVALGVVGFFREAQNYNARTRWFLISLLVGIFLMVVAASRVQAPIHEYYFYVLLPLWPLILGIAGSSLYLRGHRSPIDQRLLVAFACSGLGLFMLSWQGRYRGDELPAWHTVQHGREIASLVMQIENETIEEGGMPVFFRKSDHLRANAIYYFLGSERFPLMQFSGKLAEFRSTKVLSRARYLRKFAGRALYIGCPRHQQPKNYRQLKRMGVLWRAERPADSLGCVSCSACEVTLYRRDGAVVRLK